MGLTLVARSAGNRQAAVATEMSSAAFPANDKRIVRGDSEQQRLQYAGQREGANESKRDADRDERSPLTRIMPSTSRRCAPIAIRMPISCVRWTTEWAMTP